MIKYPNGQKYAIDETLLKTPKKSKYKAIKTEVNGIIFDSKKEANRYNELRVLEQCGEIKNLRLQVPFELIPKSKYGKPIRYIADFAYNEEGNAIVEDVKGIKTPVYRLKKRLMAEKYGIKIKET